MTITDNELLSFKAISSFISDLAEIFSKDQKSLLLYNHLINKTTISHESGIKKNIEVFRKFCINNRDSIFGKEKILSDPILQYSENAFIDMEKIFSIADKDTKNIINQHLLIISALVDPTGKAKDFLKSKKNNENNFLKNIIDTVEKNVDPNSNPMEAINNILQTGVFSEMVSGMNDGLKDGSLDLGTLLSSVNSIVSGMTEKMDDKDENKKMITDVMSCLNKDKIEENPSEMINQILNKMGDKKDTVPPELLNMFSALNPASNGGNIDLLSMMSSIGSSSSSKTIEEQLEEEYQKAKKDI